MTKKNLIISFFIIFVLFSCANTNDTLLENDGYINLTIDPKKAEPIKLSEIASEIEYVKLESRPDIYIGYSYNIAITDDLIYITGAASSGQCLCCFDKHGSFKYKIGRRGKGPGEYIDITDICVNPGTQQVEILDENTKKIIIFNQDGTFSEEIKLPLRATNFNINSDGTYLVRTRGLLRIIQETDSIVYQLHHITKDGQTILRSSFPMNPIYDYRNDAYISSFSGDNWFQLGYRDTIFRVNPSGEINGAFCFDFQDNPDQFYKRLQNNINQTNTIDFLNSYIGKAHITDVIATPDFIYFYFTQRDKLDHLSHYRVYLSQKSQHFKFTSEYLINDIDGVRLGQAACGTMNNQLVFIIDSEGLIEESKSNNSPEFRKVFDQINPEGLSDDAVLAFVNMKAF